MIFGRPSMGAWVCYGLGSESQDLPGFVVFSTGKKGPSGGNSNWGSGFLPTVYQGVQFRTAAIRSSTSRTRRASIRRSSTTRWTPSASSTRSASRRTGDPEIATRINSYEMAFRMQMTAPEVMDITPRAAAHPRPLRRRAGQAVVRQHLPAGPPPARARRAVRGDLPRSLGPARQPRRAT